MAQGPENIFKKMNGWHEQITVDDLQVNHKDFYFDQSRKISGNPTSLLTLAVTDWPFSPITPI